MSEQNSNDDINLPIRWWYSARRKRLIGVVTTLHSELRALLKLNEADKDDAVYSACEALLKRAKMACGKWYEADLGWHCINAALRLATIKLSDDERKTIAVALREETDKLGFWRKQSIEKLLPEAKEIFPESEKQKRTESETLKHNLFRSLLILHDHNGNIYYKIAAVQWQLMILSFIAVAIAGLWIKYAPELVSGETAVLWKAEWRAFAALTGIMGATLSGILSVSKNSIQDRIPDQLLNWRVTMAKLSVGMISALVLQAALISGLLKFGETKITPGIILMAAFAAGFIERLVDRAIETLNPPSKS